jgi:hypothetical protein
MLFDCIIKVKCSGHELGTQLIVNLRCPLMLYFMSNADEKKKILLDDWVDWRLPTAETIL